MEQKDQPREMNQERSEPPKVISEAIVSSINPCAILSPITSKSYPIFSEQPQQTEAVIQPREIQEFAIDSKSLPQKNSESNHGYEAP